jgi:hypothetical protein
LNATAGELELVVEEELAGGGAGLDGEGGEGAIFCVELEHSGEVDVADYVDVVKEEGLVADAGARAGGIFLEEPGGFFQAAAGVQELVVFAGDFEAHAEIFFGLEIVDDHLGVVVNVDDGFGDAEGLEAGESDFEEGAAVEFDEGFRAIVGEGAKASAEAGGEDHGFHGRNQ